MNKNCMTSVRAVIKNKNNKYLFVQRSRDVKRNKFFWEFPGGKTDCKPPKQSIKKEVKEEIGLKFINPKFKGEKKIDGYYVRYYEGKVSGKIKIQASEVNALAWFTKSWAKKMNLVNHTRMYLK